MKKKTVTLPLKVVEDIIPHIRRARRSVGILLRDIVKEYPKKKREAVLFQQTRLLLRLEDIEDVLEMYASEAKDSGE